MERATASYFLGTRAIFEKFIALLGFHPRELQISKVDMKSCPVEAWEIICDVLVACLRLSQTREGHALPPGYRNYLSGMPDATVEILGESYDAGIPRELARCHHMGPVGCGKSLGAFRISLP
jgi:hypothetical protein